MEVEHFPSAEEFLERTQAELELNEAVNSLILGLSGRLVQHPEWYKVAPCLKAVFDAEGLVLAALMTPPHNLVVYHHRGDLDGAAHALVDALLRGAWSVPGVFGSSEAASAVADAWAEITGARTRLAGRQRAYELREVALPTPDRGRLRLAMDLDVDLVGDWHYAFHHEIFGGTDLEQARQAAQARIEAGDIFLWDDAGAVSMAMKNRPTRRGITVSLVYTPPELRGRGYATACVSELSRLLLSEGREFCALFADLENPTSNHIYQEIGYRPACDFHEVRFEGE